MSSDFWNALFWNSKYQNGVFKTVIIVTSAWRVLYEDNDEIYKSHLILLEKVGPFPDMFFGRSVATIL